jgi:hypothetical protein
MVQGENVYITERIVVGISGAILSLLMDVNEWINSECAGASFLIFTYVTRLLIHIHQKEKITPEIVVNVKSINGLNLYGRTLGIFLIGSRDFDERTCFL